MSLNHVKLATKRWARVRVQAFRRDGYRCRTCHKPGRLEAHHEPPLREGSDPYALDGIQTLCRGCHIRRHEADCTFPERLEWRRRVNAILFHD